MSFLPSNNLMKENSPYPRSSQSKYVMYCKSRIYKLEQYAWKSKTYPSSLLVHWIFYKVWRAFYFGVSTSKWKELREKCPNTELFLVRIFLYSDWIRRFTREKCSNTELFMVRIFLYSDWIRRFIREKCSKTKLFLVRIFLYSDQK